MTLTAASPSSSLSLQAGGRLFKRLEDQPEIEDAVLEGWVVHRELQER